MYHVWCSHRNIMTLSGRCWIRFRNINIRLFSVYWTPVGIYFCSITRNDDTYWSNDCRSPASQSNCTKCQDEPVLPDCQCYAWSAWLENNRLFQKFITVSVRTILPSLSAYMWGKKVREQWAYVFEPYATCTGLFFSRCATVKCVYYLLSAHFVSTRIIDQTDRHVPFHYFEMARDKYIKVIWNFNWYGV
jgi:hypothetical protein